MKVLISIFIGLLVPGCTTVPVKELTTEEKKVVGEYQSKFNGHTLKYVFMKNGAGAWFLDGKKEQAYSWAVVNGEIQYEDDDDIYVYSINDDLSITYIAIIRDGKRDDSIKFADITFKKTK
ncbi:MAG TPA: hypothetical protein DCP89_05295 [Acidimicrobiaceae bacterium]|nr:hypothetical protein [Acidimicrobiaceae bacterium]